MMKLQPMMSYIVDKKRFGNKARYVIALLVQSSGLAHEHFLFFLARALKQQLECLGNVDEFMCDKIPSVLDQEPLSFGLEIFN